VTLCDAVTEDIDVEGEEGDDDDPTKKREYEYLPHSICPRMSVSFTCVVLTCVGMLAPQLRLQIFTNYPTV